MDPDVFQQLIEPLSSVRDVVDVLLVAILLYYVLMLIRGTRAVQVIFGIVAFAVIYYLARWLDLNALETTFENFLIILPLAVLVLFQHEIRRALANFGRTPFSGWGHRRGLAKSLNEVAIAAATLSERRIGALIVFERQEGLRNYVENGVQLDAQISLDLLVALFHPESPTHDGAVILQGDRLAAATCFLPLTRNAELSKELGTRHRAALGISEETDAVALVVSEENGEISLATEGVLHRKLDSSSLLTLLYRYLISSEGGRGPGLWGLEAAKA
jgi:diadenylate cyclase